MGYRFRRQVVIEPCVVDFACLEAGLIIEADGGQHSDQVACGARRTSAVPRISDKYNYLWTNCVPTFWQLWPDGLRMANYASGGYRQPGKTAAMIFPPALVHGSRAGHGLTQDFCGCTASESSMYTMIFVIHDYEDPAAIQTNGYTPEPINAPETVLRVSEQDQPRRPTGSGIWFVTRARKIDDQELLSHQQAVSDGSPNTFRFQVLGDGGH
jgi:hypothetical protein